LARASIQIFQSPKIRKMNLNLNFDNPEKANGKHYLLIAISEQGNQYLSIAKYIGQYCEEPDDDSIEPETDEEGNEFVPAGFYEIESRRSETIYLVTDEIVAWCDYPNLNNQR
jgi:hypothetical protein